MHSTDALNRIKSTGIVACMRGAFPPDVALRVSEVLMHEGITVFELLMNSEQPIAAMQALKAGYGDDACVGMGTVLDVDSAHAVLEAGADFVVSPAFQPDVVSTVMERGVLVGPGVATPSEAVAAWDMGVEADQGFSYRRAGYRLFRGDVWSSESHDLHVQRRHERSKRA